MSSPTPEHCCVGASALEYCRQFLRLASWNSWISIARTNENGRIAEVPNYVGCEGHHHAEKHRCREVMGVKQNETGCDVRTLGIPNGDQLGVVLKWFLSTRKGQTTFMQGTSL